MPYRNLPTRQQRPKTHHHHPNQARVRHGSQRSAVTAADATGPRKQIAARTGPCTPHTRSKAPPPRRRGQRETAGRPYTGAPSATRGHDRSPCVRGARRQNALLSFDPLEDFNAQRRITLNPCRSLRTGDWYRFGVRGKGEPCRRTLGEAVRGPSASRTLPSRPNLEPRTRGYAVTLPSSWRQTLHCAQRSKKRPPHRPAALLTSKTAPERLDPLRCRRNGIPAGGVRRTQRGHVIARSPASGRPRSPGDTRQHPRRHPIPCSMDHAHPDKPWRSCPSTPRARARPAGPCAGRPR